MGNAVAKQAPAAINDYELVIRVSKELEWILETYFGAQGKGLHEKISAADSAGLLPAHLTRRMRYLATIRNKLIHERGFDAIPDRARFLGEFESSRGEIEDLLAYRDAARRHQQAQAQAQPQQAVAKSSGGCVIM